MVEIKKEYLVQVTVVEGRYLKGKDASGTSDPYVKIRCGNTEPQITTTKESTNSATWNQSFTFTDIKLSDLELQLFELIFEVFDYNSFMTDELIGSYSIGLSTMHLNLNHEFYKAWLPLIDVSRANEPQVSIHTHTHTHTHSLYNIISLFVLCCLLFVV